MERITRGGFLRLLDPVIGQPGLIGGHRLVAAMREVVGDPRIEELAVPFTAAAVDMERQRVVWLRSGPLWDALRASFAIPGLFTPQRVHGRELVDGGLLAPLPITATRLSDAHRLVAVDMHSRPRRPPGDPADGVQAPPPRPSRLGRWLGRRLGGPVADASLVDTMSRALDTMQAQISRVQLALDPPELVIEVPRDVCQFYEFWRAKEVVRIGREVAETPLVTPVYYCPGLRRSGVSRELSHPPPPCDGRGDREGYPRFALIRKAPLPTPPCLRKGGGATLAASAAPARPGDSVAGFVQGVFGHFAADADDFLRAPELVELADVARNLDDQLGRIE